MIINETTEQGRHLSNGLGRANCLPISMTLIRYLQLFFWLLIGLSTQTILADVYRVGAAKRVVNPDVASYLAGYGRDRAVTGVLDNIYVKAVVISDKFQTLALITIDNIGLTRPDVVRLQNAVAAKQNNLQPDHIVVSSTHTHSGPDVVGLWGSSFLSSGRSQTYVDKLVTAATDAVIQAFAERVPVTSRTSSRQVPLKWVTNVSEPTLLDPTLSVLQFVGGNGETVATLTNYACHPTVLGPGNTLVSADYVAAFYDYMEQKLSGEHLFLQGAIGGWVQPIELDEHDSAVDAMARFGQDLAKNSVNLIIESPPNLQQPLEFATQAFDVELDNWGFRLMMWLGVLDRELFAGAMRTSVAWFRIGGAQFVTHPGETSPTYSLQSRVLMDSDTTFVLGLTQDAMGYILKPEYFDDDVTIPNADYLTSVSVGPTAGPTLMRVLGELIAKQKKET